MAEFSSLFRCDRNEPISVEIGDFLTKIEEGIYTDNELALHAILRDDRRMVDSEKEVADVL